MHAFACVFQAAVGLRLIISLVVRVVIHVGRLSTPNTEYSTSPNLFNNFLQYPVIR